MEIRGRDVEAGGKASEKSPGKILCVHNLYQGVKKIFLIIYHHEGRLFDISIHVDSRHVPFTLKCLCFFLPPSSMAWLVSSQPKKLP